MKSKLLFLFFLSVLFGCDSNSTKIEAIYKNRSEIQRTFENTSLIIRKGSIYLSLYSDSLENSYLFTGDSISLVNEHIEFELEGLCDLSNKDSLSKYVSHYIDLMNSYEILSVGGDFHDTGITLILYLKGCRMYYVENKSRITNYNWIDFINQANKLDENWYWVDL